MSSMMRWRLATPLITLNLLCLGAIVLRVRIFWSLDDPAEHVLTVLFAVMFTVNLGLGISIGVDRRIRDTPWLRVAAMILIFTLAYIVGWIGDKL
jgi:hypothetical protein